MGDYCPSGLFEIRYYFENDKCGACGRFNAVLVGRTIEETGENRRKFKFLFEWKPYINVNVNGKYEQWEARTVDQWKKVIGAATIYDTYDRRYTWEEFMAKVVEPLQKEENNPGFYIQDNGYNFNSDGTFEFDYGRHCKWLNEHRRVQNEHQKPA